MMEFVELLKSNLESQNMMLEMPIANIIRILFPRQKVIDEVIDRKLMSFREYSIDYIISLPNDGKPPAARFWLIKDKKLLEEVNAEHND